MNYDGPRQVDPNAARPDAGKWRYTSMNDGRVWPIGYCAQGCPGHDTEREAREHQTQYLLDVELHLDGQYSDTQFRCEFPTLVESTLPTADVPSTCGRWTDRFAEVGWALTWSLCDEHRTREVVAELLGTIGTSIHS